MSFPQEFNTIQFSDQAVLSHKDGIIVFVYKNALVVVHDEVPVYSAAYESHPYARKDAERATIQLAIKELSPTEVRRNLEAELNGVDTSIDPLDVF